MNQKPIDSSLNKSSSRDSRALIPIKNLNLIHKFDTSDLISSDFSSNNSSFKKSVNISKIDNQNDSETIVKDNKKQRKSSTNASNNNSNTNQQINLTSKQIYKLHEELTKKNKNIIAQRFFTMSLLEYACSLSTNNKNESDYLYEEISKRLVESNIIPAAFTLPLFKQIRFQYNLLIRQMFEYRHLPPQITYNVSNNNEKLVRSRSVDSSSSNNRNPIHSTYSVKDLLYSRYVSEYTELCHLGRGGFGSVFKARNNLDGNEYAIKKILFKKDSTDFTSKVLREIKVFSSLNHPNIVNYHNCWLENVLVPMKDDTDNSNKTDSESFATSGPKIQLINDSDSESKIEFIKDDKENNKNYDDNDNSDDSHNKTLKEQHVEYPSSDETSSEKGFFTKPKNTTKINNNEFSYSDFSSSNHSSKKASFSNQFQTNFNVSKLTNRIILYIQMKLCDFTLKQWLEKRNETVLNESFSDIKIDEKLNLNLFRQILEGVNYIHLKGIIHRDLKPGNIFLINDSMQIKIGDFGLACAQIVPDHDNLLLIQSKYIDSEDEDDEENENISIEHTKGVGTSLYSSPEQLTAHAYDAKTDLYSLGIILFELYQPFKTEMERHISIGKLKSTYEFPDYIKNNYPKICDIIKLLLSKDPSKRPTALSLLNSELFMDANQIIDYLRRVINDKENEISELRNRLKEKEELLEQNNQIINTLCGLKYYL